MQPADYSYHIGMFFPVTQAVSLRAGTNEQLVLCYSDLCFQFYLVDQGMIPPKYLANNYSNNCYSDFQVLLPVLCKIGGHANKVREILFLSDFPTIRPSDCNEGVQTGFSILVKEPTKDSILLYNNAPFINNSFRSDSERILVQLLTNYVAIKSQISLLSGIANYIVPKSYETEQKKRVISDFKEHINSFNLDNILSSLKVTIWDHYHTKIGDDDTYSVYKCVEIADDSVVLDGYLKSLIGVGENCIHRSLHYGGYFERYPTGVYSGSQLELEKEKILSAYSKEEHMAYLFFEQLEKQKQASAELGKWRSFLNKVDHKLHENYQVNKICPLSEGFLYNFKNKLTQLNEHLYSLQFLPTLKIIITGDILTKQLTLKYSSRYYYQQSEKLYYNTIGEIFEVLRNTYHIVLISGDVRGADKVALKYARENMIDIIFFPSIKLGREDLSSYFEMAKGVDRLFITKNLDSYINQNFIKVAKELDIPIKFIDTTN